MKYVLKVNWCFLVQWNLFTQCFFTESAHWANSVIESQCPSVCLFVCLWRLKRPSSRGRGDLWSKNLFLIIILGGNFVSYYFFFGKKNKCYQPLFGRQRKQKYWCYYPHRSRDLVSPVCGFFYGFHIIFRLWRQTAVPSLICPLKSPNLSYCTWLIPPCVLNNPFDLITVYSPSTLPITWPKL
jgi:hypothetical protein